MKLPTAITITQYASYLDGGTTVITATDERGRQLDIRLNQRTFDYRFPLLFPIAKRFSNAKTLPGRLLFDGILVPVRSDSESRVLALIDDAKINTDDSERSRELVDSEIRRLIAFVRSEDYPVIAGSGKIPEVWVNTLT